MFGRAHFELVAALGTAVLAGTRVAAGGNWISHWKLLRSGGASVPLERQLDNEFFGGREKALADGWLGEATNARLDAQIAENRQKGRR